MNVLRTSASYLKIAVIGSLVALAGCAGYDDDVRPPSDQELQDARNDIKPQNALREGVFHMQQVGGGSTVRVKDVIQLKKPDLPPFEVAYIGRDVESVILELANAAGESVVIPEGLRGRKVTLVHSGANFQDMLDLVLSKAGYHYNYVNGVWYITRYPVRNYVLEIGQSSRKGSLSSKSELSPELAAGTSNTATGSELDTDYTDTVWAQVKDTLGELIKVGASAGQANALNATGVTATGQLITSPGGASSTLGSVNGLLPPPEVAGAKQDNKLFASVSGTTPMGTSSADSAVQAPTSTDHLSSEDNAQPWFKVTESAGLITVRASTEAHRQIEDYLEQVQSSALRQITVEARIVALIRDKTVARGADLSKSVSEAMNTAMSRIGFFGTSQAQTLSASSANVAGGFLTFASKSGDLGLVIQSLSTLGDVYTISTPTLVARNNQLSRVSVTRQLGYAETNVTQNTTSTGDIVIGSRQDTAKFKNSGTVMSVLPFIGKNRVQMRFRLSVASKAGETSISTSIGTSSPVVNKVPEMSNNVVDQDMVLEFGRVYAIGGLVENNTTITNQYEPNIRQIPGLGEILQNAEKRGVDTEFLVLIKVSRA